MGVKGFWQFLERFLDFHEFMKEYLQPGTGDSVLLVDDNNIMFTLIHMKVREDTQTTLGFPSDGRYGGSYGEYRDVIVREFTKLQAMGFKLEVYFDGRPPPLKEIEISARRTFKNMSWATLYDVLISEHITFDLKDLPLPALTKHILEVVIRREFPEIQIFHCQNEADHVMGMKCNLLNSEGTKAYVYSNDSDFAVMPGCALLKLGTFQDDTFQNAVRSGNFDLRTFPVEVWRRDKVAHLLGLSDAKFGEFLLILGSDYTTMLRRNHLTFNDVPNNVLSHIGVLSTRNNQDAFDKILYLAKHSGPQFRVNAPIGTLFSSVQEHALEYTRHFWGLTMEDEARENELSGRIVRNIPQADWDTLREVTEEVEEEEEGEGAVAVVGGGTIAATFTDSDNEDEESDISSVMKKVWTVSNRSFLLISRTIFMFVLMATGARISMIFRCSC